MKGEAATATKMVTLTFDGKPVTVEAGTSVWEASRRATGKTIPALCHSHYMGLNPVAHIGGGFTAWRDAGGPVDLSPKPPKT